MYWKEVLRSEENMKREKPNTQEKEQGTNKSDSHKSRVIRAVTQKSHRRKVKQITQPVESSTLTRVHTQDKGGMRNTLGRCISRVPQS